MVGQQPLELFILGSNPSSAAKNVLCLYNYREE